MILNKKNKIELQESKRTHKYAKHQQKKWNKQQPTLSKHAEINAPYFVLKNRFKKRFSAAKEPVNLVYPSAMSKISMFMLSVAPWKKGQQYVHPETLRLQRVAEYEATKQKTVTELVELKLRLIKKLQDRFDLDERQTEFLKGVFEPLVNKQEVSAVYRGCLRFIREIKHQIEQLQPPAIGNKPGTFREQFVAQLDGLGIPEKIQELFRRDIDSIPSLNGQTPERAWFDIAISFCSEQAPEFVLWFRLRAEGVELRDAAIGLFKDMLLTIGSWTIYGVMLFLLKAVFYTTLALLTLAWLGREKKPPGRR